MTNVVATILSVLVTNVAIQTTDLGRVEIKQVTELRKIEFVWEGRKRVVTFDIRPVCKTTKAVDVEGAVEVVVRGGSDCPCKKKGRRPQ